MVACTIRFLTTYSYQALFAFTIFTLALIETRRGHLGRRFSILGDISYSTYLLHFPLQILFFAIAAAFQAERTFFSTPWSLLLFFVVLIPISTLCHYSFERPVQGWIRRRFLPVRATGPTQLNQPCRRDEDLPRVA
jgi:peptidoglycan/LPS O-acetylase OafA/YrhL